MVASVRRDRAMASAAARRSPDDQREVGCLDGDVGARADGKPEVGLGQRGGVVDAVADHGHDLARILQPPDLGRLALGQHVGETSVDADFGGDGAGGALVVAGEQHRGEAERPQLSDRLAAGGLHPVGQGDQAQRLGRPSSRR